MQPIEEEEWPDEPTGEDSVDLSGLPDWLSYILVLDDLHQRGLQDISGRYTPRGRVRQARWYQPRDLCVSTIPVRELDDPPDSEGTDGVSAGIIEELSEFTIAGTINEDNKSS